MNLALAARSKPFSSSRTRMTAMETAIKAGWAFCSHRQIVWRTLPHDVREFFANSLINFIKNGLGCWNIVPPALCPFQLF